MLNVIIYRVNKEKYRERQGKCRRHTRNTLETGGNRNKYRGSKWKIKREILGNTDEIQENIREIWGYA